MITILGVGHVFDISEQVRHAILQAAPQAVCIELDALRYHALRSPQEERQKADGIYEQMYQAQKQAADEYGGTAGSEMLAAADAAAEIGAELCLIDMDIRKLFDRISEEMTLREKIRISLSSFTARFRKKKSIDEEMEHYQEDTEAYMEELAKQLPTMKRILVDERNEFMAENILKAAESRDAVAVIGDGHVDGILKLLKDQEVKVIRLKELRSSEE